MQNQTAQTQAGGGQDFDALLKEKDFQSEFDRRVSRALETARGKWAQETKQKVEHARAEAERLARMSGEERMAHDFAQREAELAQRERTIVRRELRAEALRMLSERRLPAELAEALSYESAEQVNASMDAAERAFRQAVQQGVEERMRGSVPVSAHRKEPTAVSDADYYRSNYVPGKKN